MSRLIATAAGPAGALPNPVFDAESGGDYNPDLYRPDTIADPVTYAPGAPMADARNHWEEHGWLAVRGVVGAADIAAAKQSLDDLIGGNAPGFEGLMYERMSIDTFDALSPAQKREAVRKLWSFCVCDPRMAGISGLENIRSVLNVIFDAKEFRMFQDMALLKPPHCGREKPWHQDHAFFDFPLGTRIAGVWIALDPATIENGCMQLIDRGHRAGPKSHFRRRDWQICDKEMLGRHSVAFPLSPGDALFFDGLIPHGTPANRTGDRRWALQFHYCTSDASEAAKDSRLAIFGGEGNGATC